MYKVAQIRATIFLVSKNKVTMFKWVVSISKLNVNKIKN